jgi:hypothetical protein
MRLKFRTFSWIIPAVLITSLAGATGMDLHRMWDNRCLECHGHSGAFARQFLSVSSGQLQGRHHTDNLHRFLSSHYLSDSEVDAIYSMLLAQASTPAKFENECSKCHETAAIFVRQSLEFQNGVLFGRASGQRVSEFLRHHRTLSPDDVEFFENLLRRIATEIYRP